MGNKNSNSSNVQISVYHNNSKITNSNKSISTTSKSSSKSQNIKSSDPITTNVKSVEIKSEDVKPVIALEEVKSEEVKSEEVKSEEVKSEEVKSEEVKSEEVKSEEVKSEEVKSEEVKSEEVKSEVKSEEVKSEVSDIMINIVKLFASKDEVADIIKLLKLDITEETKKKLVDLLELLTQDTSEDNIILSIANETKKMLSDNKIDIYDIPSFIKIATDVFSVKLNIGDIKKVETSDVCKLIEIICVGLVKKNIINLDDTIEDEKLIRGITSSISLLETTIKISKSKCFCCKKK